MNFIAILGVVAFAIGSIPSGYILGRIQGVDIRKHGSGNVGATNAGRVLGKRAGVTVLLLDVFKAMLAASLYRICGNGESSALVAGAEPAVLGTIALLGHCYSPFLHFRGGKGVACGLGAFLIAAPTAAALATLVFLAFFLLTKIVSLASIAAAISLPLSLIVGDFLGIQSIPALTQLAALVSAGVVLFRHQTNIARLRAGTEPRFQSKRSASSTES